MSDGNFDITGVTTIDGVVAYACSSDGQVYKTSDAGQSWNSFYTESELSLYSITQSDESNLMIIGDNNFVAKSIDGGVTWSTLSVFTYGSTSSFLASIHSLSMISPSVAFAGSPEGILMQTRTGGMIWYECSIMNSEQVSYIYTVNIYSTDVGVAGKNFFGQVKLSM